MTTVRSIVLAALAFTIGSVTAAQALDRPEPACHRDSAEQSTCTIRVNDEDLLYKIRVKIIINGVPEWIAVFKGEE